MNVVVMLMRELDDNHTVVFAPDGDYNHVYDRNDKENKDGEDDDHDADVQEKESARSSKIDHDKLKEKKPQHTVFTVRYWATESCQNGLSVP